MAHITLTRLRSLLDYDPQTGIFTWRKSRLDRSGRSKVGKQAGSLLPPRQYVRLAIDSIQYKAHELAWFHYHGKWPEHGVVHLDGVKSNNAIANLKENQRKAIA